MGYSKNPHTYDKAYWDLLELRLTDRLPAELVLTLPSPQAAVSFKMRWQAFKWALEQSGNAAAAAAGSVVLKTEKGSPLVLVNNYKTAFAGVAEQLSALKQLPAQTADTIQVQPTKTVEDIVAGAHEAALASFLKGKVDHE